MMLTSVVLQRPAYSASRSACYSAIMSTDSRRFCSSSKSEHVGQRVLVTGGANGVGRGIVDRFVREGAMVAYADIVKEGMTVGFAKPQFSNVDSRVSVVAANIPTCPGTGTPTATPVIWKCLLDLPINLTSNYLTAHIHFHA